MRVWKDISPFYFFLALVLVVCAWLIFVDSCLILCLFVLEKWLGCMLDVIGMSPNFWSKNLPFLPCMMGCSFREEKKILCLFSVKCKVRSKSRIVIFFGFVLHGLNETVNGFLWDVRNAA